MDKYLEQKILAPRANLFQYTMMYKMGDIYLNVKTMLVRHIELTFLDRKKLYTALSLVATEEFSPLDPGYSNETNFLYTENKLAMTPLPPSKILSPQTQYILIPMIVHRPKTSSDK